MEGVTVKVEFVDCSVPMEGLVKTEITVKEEPEDDLPPITTNTIVPVRIMKEVVPMEKSNNMLFIEISPLTPRINHTQSETTTLESPPKAKRPRCTLRCTQKEMVSNFFNYVYNEKSKSLAPFEILSKTECAKEVAKSLGICAQSVIAVIMEQDETIEEPLKPKPPKKSRSQSNFKERMDDASFSAIRQTIHEFYHRNKLPTLGKVIQAVNDDPNLPNLPVEPKSLMKYLNFKFDMKSGESILVDKPETMFWRQQYLTAIKQCRSEGRCIYYQGETNLILEKLPPSGLKNSTERNKVTLSHIGGDEGFIKEALLVSDTKAGMIRNKLDTHWFENWFAGILKKLKPNSALVINSAPYNSRKRNNVPKISWTKENIHKWLNNNSIEFETGMVKAELIDIVKQKKIDKVYVVDEQAKTYGITVLRIPPFHSQLNPIVSLWSQVKEYISRKSTSKLPLKELLQSAISEITAQKWIDSIAQVKNEEKNMFRLNNLIDNATDTFTLLLSHSDSDSKSD